MCIWLMPRRFLTCLKNTQLWQKTDKNSSPSRDIGRCAIVLTTVDKTKLQSDRDAKELDITLWLLLLNQLIILFKQSCANPNDWYSGNKTPKSSKMLLMMLSGAKP